MKVKIDMRTLQVVSIELDTKDRIDRLVLKELDGKTSIGKLIGKRLEQGVKIPC